MVPPSCQRAPLSVCGAQAILQRHDTVPLGHHDRWHAGGARTSCRARHDPAALNPQASDGEVAGSQTYRSFGWARATGPDGATAEAWLQTGESYAFTAAASIRAVEETFTRSLRGAISPAAAFGDDFAFTIQNTTRIETIPAEAPPFAGYPG
jgi:hypothetical protein